MGKCFSTKNENKTQQNYTIINNVNINNNGANYYYNTNPTYISERNIQNPLNIISFSGICCPACGEPSNKNFKGSGEDKAYFDCLKCGEHQSGKSYYYCRNCKAIFCSRCLYNRNNNFRFSCPSCGEPSGNKFRGSGENQEYYDCLKCGYHQSGKSYYECLNCKGIFCYRCPQINNNETQIKTFCPACREPAGINFFGYDKEYFDCLKCGNHQSGKNCYKCNNCKGIFCYNCPHKRYNNIAICPSCNEPAGNLFKGGDQEYFDCLRCGSHQSGKNCFKCFNCRGIFCYRCPYN